MRDKVILKKTASLIVCTLMVSVFLTPLPQSVSLTSAAQAQEKEKKKKPKTRRSQVLGKQAFARITSAQEALAEGKHTEALNVLNDMLTSDRYKPYEKGVAQQTIGYVWADKGDYKRALREFERALSMDVLPDNVALDLTYNLAQLNLAEDNPKTAMRHLDRWFALSPDPGPSAYGLKAQIYLVMENLPQAEKYVKIAIKKAKEPKEAWYRILLSVYLQKERYKEALPVLETVVEKFPGKKAFWQQLSAVYFELNKEDAAFAAQQSMHAQGMLTKSKELVRLAQLYLYNDYPYKAARILDKGLKSGDIKKTEKNWELLANSWMHARGWKRSRTPLRNAASLSKSGKFYVQLGQAYIQDEEWKNAEKYLLQGVKKGNLKKKEANTYLVLGITQAKLGKFEDAIKTFRKAGDFDDTAKDAFRWIRSLERQLAEKARQKEQAEKEQAEKEKAEKETREETG
jgi:tetratricopeptide (TPR) repeat protein